MRGKLPIIVGGTHYYIQSLIWDSLLDVPAAPPVSDDLDSLSTEELYRRLQEVDPEQPHHPNQRKRILSDLRLYAQTRQAPSQLRKQSNEQSNSEEQLDNVVIWMSCNGAVLNSRLDGRVDAMVRAGLLRENCDFVKRFVEGSDVSRGVWQAIGLKEFMPLFLSPQGAYNGRTELREEEEAVQAALREVKSDTQQYAKRWVRCGRLRRSQITWIRNRLQGRVKHLLQVDTSQLEHWEEAVLSPVVNVVEHLLQGTLPDVVINQEQWQQQQVT